MRYGLTKNIRRFNPLQVAFHEYAAVWRDVRGARNWRDRLGYMFGGPAWQPPPRAAGGAPAGTHAGGGAAGRCPVSTAPMHLRASTAPTGLFSRGVLRPRVTGPWWAELAEQVPGLDVIDVHTHIGKNDPDGSRAPPTSCATA